MIGSHLCEYEHEYEEWTFATASGSHALRLLRQSQLPGVGNN